MQHVLHVQLVLPVVNVLLQELMLVIVFAKEELHQIMICAILQNQHHVVTMVGFVQQVLVDQVILIHAAKQQVDPVFNILLLPQDLHTPYPAPVVVEVQVVAIIVLDIQLVLPEEEAVSRLTIVVMDLPIVQV